MSGSDSDKFTTMMPPGKASYRYVAAGKDSRGRKVRFCWSCWRNVDGYFLGWKEVVGPRFARRSLWVARKVRKRAEELAQRRAEAFKARRT